MSRRSNETRLQSPQSEDDQGNLENDQLPLSGVVLCCTSIPAEDRDGIAEAAKEMGAIMRLDLTADVTHLIVGQIDTPKYKYTAKSRPDIRVLRATWLGAVRKAWLAGNSVDVRAFDEAHRLPTFFNLRICVTGFEDLQMRNELGESIEANGAKYMRDLTKEATHLVAAVPQGKKYEFAGQWGVKIVALEWVHRSLERGLVLDETLFHPLTPAEERGIGAVSEGTPHTGKRKRDKASLSKETSKRKLRRTTSTKLESQNDNIWADIGPGESAEAPAESDQWDDKSMARKTEQKQDVSRAADTRPVVQKASEPPIPLQNGLFVHDTICIHGFEPPKFDILREHLEAGGASICPWQSVQGAPDDNPHLQGRNITIMVPFNANPELLHRIEVEKAGQYPVVSEWWAESCLFDKEYTPKDHALAQPLDCPPIQGFSEITVCPTSFTGMDLLHFSKAMKHIGAHYDETLTQNTSVLVCGSASQPKIEKLRYAVARDIPIVSAEWAWACIRNRRIENFEGFLLNPRRASQPATSSRQSSHPKEPTPRADRPDTLKASTPSQPLQDITPKANSQARSQRSNGAAEGCDDDRYANSAKQRRADSSAQSTHDAEAFQGNDFAETQASTAIQQERMKDAIAQLQRQKKEASASGEDLGKAKRRQLGRAPSNPSSLASHVYAASEPLPSQLAAADDEELGVSALNKARSASVFRPSQTLTYENEQSVAAREQLSRRAGSGSSSMTGEGKTMKRVESTGIAKGLQGNAKASRRRQVERQ